MPYPIAGVYPILIDQSTLVRSSSTSIAATVGAFSEGKINTRVPVTNSKDAVALFGKPNAAYSYAQYCILNYLETGGLCWTTRVVGTGALHSALKINKTGATGATQSYAGITVAQSVGATSAFFTSDTDSAFLIRSENPGKWSNALKVEVTGLDATNNVFTINVYRTIDSVDNLVESFGNLSLDPSAVDGYNRSMYLENVINQKSLYIRAYKNTGIATLPLMPQAIVPTSLASGADGSLPTTADVVAGWALYDNKDDVEIDLLINSGYVTSTDFGVQNKMLNLAISRRDCRALLDVPLTEIGMSPTVDATNWRNSVQNFNSYFSSLDVSWVNITDNITGQIKLDIPPSGFVAQCMARKDNLKNPWNAAAGTQLSGNIGLITSSYFSINGLTKSYTSSGSAGGQQGLLANANINFFRNKPGIGIVRWGQKTQQTKASALDRENVATLSIVIENSVSVFLENAVFELNVKPIRDDIKESVDQFMNQIQAKLGVYTFQVICDETNNTPVVIDNNQMVVDIIYQPTKTAEAIILRSTIDKTGAVSSTTAAA